MLNLKEKFQDPRWQRRSKKIMDRDGWRCAGCGSERQTLSVHHLLYTRPDVWNEPAENLLTLCWDGCHKREELEIDELAARIQARQVARVLRKCGAALIVNPAGKMPLHFVDEGDKLMLFGWDGKQVKLEMCLPFSLEEHYGKPEPVVQDVVEVFGGAEVRTVER